MAGRQQLRLGACLLIGLCSLFGGGGSVLLLLLDLLEEALEVLRLLLEELDLVLALLVVVLLLFIDHRLDRLLLGLQLDHSLLLLLLALLELDLLLLELGAAVLSLQRLASRERHRAAPHRDTHTDTEALAIHVKVGCL